jgi:regulator of protease activity HflC (stomatin/prohibitin superfamily)
VNESKNTYLEEVIAQQQVVDRELKRKAAPAPAMMAMSAGRPAPQAMPPSSVPELPGAPAADGGRAIDVRITGWWRFRTVIVPPNAWVVHTRRGRTEPVHIGLGVSFPFNPYQETFLVAPATMQTLAVNARCICRERQGILVQAYVQWIIEDFKAAYQRIDFSDPTDPMRIVNLQLREQAEASIKDKVAGMSIDDVLQDKKPVIEDLTARLREVAQGQGLKIVTVQIKEAVVSSTRLWETLQKPFREAQAQVARLSELDRERVIREREHVDGVANFEMQREAERKKEQVQAQMERERAIEKAETERTKRQEEARLATDLAALEAARAAARIEEIEATQRVEAADSTRSVAALDAEIARQAKSAAAAAQRERLAIEALALRRTVDNDVSPGRVEEMLVQMLPALVAKMPVPQKSEVVHITGTGTAPDGIVALAGLIKALRAVLGKKPEAE